MDMGKEHMMDVLTPMYDNRDMWDGKLMRDPGNAESAPMVNRGRARWAAPTGR
ncbi:HNH endonuclease [Streptomyces phage Cursive]